MQNLILWQCLTLSTIILFAGFCFCDGFNLHILRKLLWYIVFLGLVISSLRARNEFDLNFILIPSILFAFLLCYYEKRKQRRK